MIELSDVLWLLFDKDGLQSLQIQGMEPHYYDFSYMPPEAPMWLVNLQAKLAEARTLIPKLGVKYVVVDTLSSICTYMDSYYLASAGKDPRLAYGDSQKRFREILLHLRALPCFQIWLCHSRSAYVDPDKITMQQKAQREASLPGECQVDLGLTRGWAEIVRPITNLTMGLDVEIAGSKATRYFITQPGGPYYVKNRYDDLLAPKEPVDLHAIFDRIEQFESNLNNRGAA